MRDGLDVLTSNETLAAAELFLAERPNRDRIMRERLGDACREYDTVVIDCAPALSLMNQNAMVYADSVVVPGTPGAEGYLGPTIVATTASQDSAPVTPDRAPRTRPATFAGLRTPWSWSSTWVSVIPHRSTWSTRVE